MSGLGLGGLGLNISDLSEGALRALISDLYFESNVTPRIHIRDPFGPVNPSLVGRMVKPQVTFVSPQFGRKVIHPWGTPDPSAFPVLVGSVVLGLGVLGYFAWKGVKCPR